MEYSKKEYFGLGKVPTGIGAVLRGWDLTEEEFRDDFRLPVVMLVHIIVFIVLQTNCVIH